MDLQIEIKKEGTLYLACKDKKAFSSGFVSSKIYDARGDFDFDIVNVPIMERDVPRRPSYGVYISHFIAPFTPEEDHEDLTTFSLRPEKIEGRGENVIKI